MLSCIPYISSPPSFLPRLAPLTPCSLLSLSSSTSAAEPPFHSITACTTCWPMSLLELQHFSLHCRRRPSTPCVVRRGPVPVANGSQTAAKRQPIRADQLKPACMGKREPSPAFHREAVLCGMSFLPSRLVPLVCPNRLSPCSLTDSVRLQTIAVANSEPQILAPAEMPART